MDCSVARCRFAHGTSSCQVPCPPAAGAARSLRLPKALWPIPPAYGHVIAFDEAGAIVADLQDPAGQYPETTGVTEIGDRLYVQSLHAKGIGWLAR